MRLRQNSIASKQDFNVLTVDKTYTVGSALMIIDKIKKTKSKKKKKRTVEEQE